MESYHFSMVGLGLDIVGAFFVAVEAIRLENLRALRDGVLRRLHAYTLSPRITFVDKSGTAVGPVQPPVPASRFPGLFMGLHYVSGFLVVVVVNEVLDGEPYNLFLVGGLWVLDRPWYAAVFLVLAFVLFGCVVGLWMVGELVHVGLTASIKLPMKVIDFVDAKTPDGTVGVIGFLLLVAGFLVQMYGAYIGGNAA